MGILNFIGFEYWCDKNYTSTSFTGDIDFLEVGAYSFLGSIGDGNIEESTNVSPTGGISNYNAYSCQFNKASTLTLGIGLPYKGGIKHEANLDSDPPLNIQDAYLSFWFKTTNLPATDGQKKEIGGLNFYTNTNLYYSIELTTSGTFELNNLYNTIAKVLPSGFIQTDQWYQVKMGINCRYNGDMIMYLDDELIFQDEVSNYSPIAEARLLKAFFNCNSGTTYYDTVVLSDDQWHPTALVTRPFTPTGIPVASGDDWDISTQVDWYASSSGGGVNKPLTDYMSYISSGHICDNHYSYFSPSGWNPYIHFKYGNNADNYGDGQALAVKVQHKTGHFHQSSSGAYAALIYDNSLQYAHNSGTSSNFDGAIGAWFDCSENGINGNVSAILPYLTGIYQVKGQCDAFGWNTNPYISSSFLSFLYLDGNPITISGSVTGTPDDGGYSTVGGGTFWSENNYDLFGNSGGEIYGIFNRFSNIQVPPSSDIVSATITVKSAIDASGTACHTIIQAEDVGNSVAPTGFADIAGASKTTAYRTWSNLPYFSGDTWYSTTDITPVILELVQRPDWQAGNAMTFFIQDSGSSSNAFRTRYDYASDELNAATLQITYIDGATSVFNNRVAPILFRNNLFFPGLK